MRLKLNKQDVEKIILAWAELEMLNMFNTAVFSTHEVELSFIEPEKSKTDGTNKDSKTIV